MSTNQIASATSKDVNKLKALTRKLGKQQQLQVEKLEGDFRDAVGRYSVLQKVRLFIKASVKKLLLIFTTRKKCIWHSTVSFDTTLFLSVNV